MKTPKLSLYNNSWYNPGGSFIKCLTWYFINILIFNNAIFPIYKLKTMLLKAFGAKIGKGVIIKPCVNIKYPWRLEVGDYSWIGENVWIDNLANVTIGSNCCISQGAMLMCGNHNYKKDTFDLIIGDIIIEDGAWIGAKAMICPGVTIQKNAILAAYSMTSKNLEENYIYQGVPATKKKCRIIE